MLPLSLLKVDSFPWWRLFIKIFNSISHTTNFLGTPHYNQSDVEPLPPLFELQPPFVLSCVWCVQFFSHFFNKKFEVDCDKHLAKIKCRWPHPLSFLCLPIIYKFLALNIFCHLEHQAYFCIPKRTFACPRSIYVFPSGNCSAPFYFCTWVLSVAHLNKTI